MHRNDDALNASSLPLVLAIINSVALVFVAAAHASEAPTGDTIWGPLVGFALWLAMPIGTLFAVVRECAWRPAGEVRKAQAIVASVIAVSILLLYIMLRDPH
jgi:hypothetical protein